MPLLYEKIWQTRHDAQIQIIKDLQASIGNNPQEEWQKRILWTAEALEKWSIDQFNFFVEGFRNRTLVSSRKLPAEYALRRTADQTAYDISVLHRAFVQRQTADWLTTLTLADKLAYMALKPAIDSGLVSSSTTVITYFQKDPRVRVIPYATVALIGIPYTCIDLKNNGRDFLAIPHEVGHYVFTNGRKDVNDKTADNQQKPPNFVNLRALIYEEVTPSLSLYQIWIEEIFADIYSTLVAGPAAALSIQRMLFDNLDLMNDHGHHPVPVIRPRTHFRVLCRMNKKAAAAGVPEPFPKKLIDNLKHHWENYLLWKRGRHNEIGDQFIIRAQSPGEQFAERELFTQYMYTTSEDILKVLDDIFAELTAHTWGKNTGITEIVNLFPNFETNQLDTGFLAQAQLSVDDKDEFENTQYRRWFDKLHALLKEGDLTFEPTVWQPLLQAGWLSNGPEDDAGPK